MIPMAGADAEIGGGTSRLVRAGLARDEAVPLGPYRNLAPAFAG